MQEDKKLPFYNIDDLFDEDISFLFELPVSENDSESFFQFAEKLEDTESDDASSDSYPPPRKKTPVDTLEEDTKIIDFEKIPDDIFPPDGSDNFDELIEPEDWTNRENDEIELKKQSSGEKQTHVVGWLVCTAGAYEGRYFDLTDGWNRIGRKKDNSLCLSEDESIRSDFYASVVYDQNNGRFHIVSDKDRKIFLNDKLLTGPVELSRYDEILIEKIKLVFIPFCDEKHIWQKF